MPTEHYIYFEDFYDIVEDKNHTLLIILLISTYFLIQSIIIFTHITLNSYKNLYKNSDDDALYEDFKKEKPILIILIIQQIIIIIINKKIFLLSIIIFFIIKKIIHIYINKKNIDKWLSITYKTVDFLGLWNRFFSIFSIIITIYYLIK